MGYTGIASNYDDSDLIPANVKDGVDIFGVEGDLASQLSPATGEETGYYDPNMRHNFGSNGTSLKSTLYYTDISGNIFLQSISYSDTGTYFQDQGWNAKIDTAGSIEFTNFGSSYMNLPSLSTYKREVREDTTNIYFIFMAYDIVNTDKGNVHVITINKSTGAFSEITDDNSGSTVARLDAWIGINLPSAVLYTQPTTPPVNLEWAKGPDMKPITSGDEPRTYYLKII